MKFRVTRPEPVPPWAQPGRAPALGASQGPGREEREGSQGSEREGGVIRGVWEGGPMAVEGGCAGRPRAWVAVGGGPWSGGPHDWASHGSKSIIDRLPQQVFRRCKICSLPPNRKTWPRPQPHDLTLGLGPMVQPLGLAHEPWSHLYPCHLGL